MANCGNFLHSFVITIPSSITRELEKKLLSCIRGRAHGESLFLWLGDSLGLGRNDKKEGRSRLPHGADSSGR